MRIAVVGAGYVGLSSALVWSHLGHEVRVLDRDADRIAMLRRGEDPLDEPLVPELLTNGGSLFWRSSRRRPRENRDRRRRWCQEGY